MSEITQRLTTAIADRYRIESHLGRGGMATVYLAEDVRHKRKVALKVLRPELAAVIGAERFLQEITLTANLQHPNILALYDSGEADTFLYYVMPYVEGDTLRDKLDREKQLGVDEAVEITKSIASALDYAHRQKVIHRDIKPENILIHDGQALVADFGIALAVSEAGGSRLTETGLSLGTPHYMSPEQAMGDREIDARSDVYSLGAMLYEMLTGEPPYTGSTAQAIVARVITEDPRPVTLQRRTVPEHVAATVHKALRKLPADRFATAAQFSDALTNPAFTVPTTAAAPAAAARGLGRFAWPAVAVAAIAAALFGWLRPAPTVDRDPVRFTLDLSEQAVLQVGAGGLMSEVAISPDGRTIIYTGRGDPETRLYLRRLDRLDWEPVTNTDGGDSPFFSPDGRWVGFRQGNRLRKVDLRTGSAVTLTPLERSSLVTGATWSPSDTIYLSLEAIGGLFKVPAEGGALERVAMDDTLSLFWWPLLLPGGEWVLSSVTPQDEGTSQLIAAVSLRTGEVRHLIDGAGFAQYIGNGRVLYLLLDGTAVTAPLDPNDPQPTTDRVPTGEVIAQNPGGAPHLGVAANGTAVFLSGSTAENTIVFVDRDGRETPLLSAPREYKDPRFSPDGRRLAYEIVDGNEGDIWIHEFDRATATRLTFESENLYPTWSPDGSRLAFTSRRSGIAGLWWKAADGSGEAEELLGGTELRFPGAFTPDGGTLLYRETAAATGFDIYALPLDGDRAPRPLIVTPFNESSPMLSPDGRWMAYVSDRSGRNEVYARAYPDGATDFQVSAGGGAEPLWDRNRSYLYYRHGTTLMQATLRATDVLEVLSRDSLFSGPYLENIRWSEYDLHPDGERFVFVRLGERGIRPTVVLNWVAELAQREGGF